MNNKTYEQLTQELGIQRGQLADGFICWDTVPPREPSTTEYRGMRGARLKGDAPSRTKRKKNGYHRG